MGESIAEATITKWLKEVGDTVDIDESLVEIATDKVDSDVPSEFKGKLIKKNFEVNDVVKVGEVIAEIETDLNHDTALMSENEDIELVSEEKEKEFKKKQEKLGVHHALLLNLSFQELSIIHRNPATFFST